MSRAKCVPSLLAAVSLLASALAGSVTPATAQTNPPTCIAETEPNDTADTGLTIGPGCFSGTLPDNDQDLYTWDVTPELAAQRWTISLDGVPGTLTGLQMLAISSDPGVTPILAGPKLLELDMPVHPTAPSVDSNIFIPAGRYIVGVSRSTTPDGGTPDNLDYSFSVQPGDQVPASGDTEPNDDAATAGKVHGAFALSGDLGASADQYAWTLSAEDATQALDLSVQAQVGAGVTMQLSDSEGTQLVSAYAATDGVATAYDLHLAAGTYRIYLGSLGDGSHPYILSTTASGVANADPEPNDDVGHAVPLDPATPSVRGRLAGNGDRDFYRLSVDAARAQVEQDIRLIWRSGPSRTLCLEDAEGNDLQCHTGDRNVALSGLALPVGDYIVRISGDADPGSIYLLRIDPTSAIQADFETEPNDSAATATPLSADTVMRARFTGADSDYFVITTTGDAQLWRLDATGTKLNSIRWVLPDSTDLGDAQVSSDGTSATLPDMYLIPGAHWFRFDGDTGDYSLHITALGPPDPNAEREPNSDSLHAEPLALGVTRTGRLPIMNDADVFRFSLSATEHVRIHLDPPADGAVGLRLYNNDGTDIAGTRSADVGVPYTYEARLLPGDYEAWLRPSVSSDKPYRLRIDREDPFAVSVDQEPNDTAAQALPMPPSLVASGTLAGDGDQDWYSLGSLDTPGSMTITTQGDPWSVAISDGTTDYSISESNDYTTWQADGLPSGVPLYLRVTPKADYTVRITAGAPAISGPAIPPPALDATLTLASAQDSVAAYWEAGQKVLGHLTIDNTGRADEQLALDTASSNDAWSVSLGQTQVDVPAGGTIDVPVTFVVPPDAWADIAVRTTVRARDAAGAQTTAFVEITPGRDAAPVAPYQAWGVPDALLGGLNVASLALGGAPVPAYDPTYEAYLYDDVTPSGSGFYTAFDGTPVTLTSDLAGDDPVPVAGTIIDPLAAGGFLTETPRDFELLLSTDGVDYQVALTGVLSPARVEQAFTLPAPIPARFAQLRISSTYGGPGSGVAVGEWKVVATPGWAPAGPPLDVADTRRGGHVVWAVPQFSSQADAQRMLGADDSGNTQDLNADAGTQLSWVIGFEDDRAAQLTELQWADSTQSDPALRLQRVDVAISTESPVGPWQEVGSWRLDRAADGSVAPFTFQAPTWASFIRFTGNATKKGTYYVEVPDAVRAIETATSPTYRSILGEWGTLDSTGPREWISPPDVGVPADVGEPNDTPQTATPLAAATTAQGRVHRGEDVDWYSLTVPADQNSLTFTVGGTPTVGVSLALFDAAGTQVPMSFGPGGTAGTIAYAGNVTPGASYTVRVEQPTFSAVFTFDTSGSMGSYLDFVSQAMRTYTSEVVKGEESALVVPFEEKPLLPDWSDEAYLLQDAVNRYPGSGGSSSGETALFDASKALAGREGARAVLTVTDAETSSYQRSQDLWAELASVRPLVFAVHVGNDSTPVEGRHFMQDWASAGGGHYQYVVSHADMDRAFERMATWLRRPAVYSLSYQTQHEQVPPPEPGTLSVVPANGPDGTPAAAPASKDVAVDIILDTSGSMLDRFGGKSRIEIAKQVLDDLVTNELPAGAPIALRVLGSGADPCGTSVAVPFGPLDAATVTGLVDPLKVVRQADTPIAAALAAVPTDLAGASGTKIVLLITDSKEIWPNKDLCGKNPADAIRSLVRQGIDARINIVGMAVDDKRARKQLAGWAALGGGAYFDARDPQQLGTAISTAVSAPFEVFDASGTSVATGRVGGAAVPLPPGTYKVEVLSDPPVTWEAVVVTTGEPLTLTLPVSTVPTPAP